MTSISCSITDSKYGLRVVSSSYVKIMDLSLYDIKYGMELISSDNITIDIVKFNWYDSGNILCLKIYQSKDIRISNVVAGQGDRMVSISSSSNIILTHINNFEFYWGITIEWSNNISLSNVFLTSDRENSIYDSNIVTIRHSSFESSYSAFRLYDCNNLIIEKTQLKSLLDSCIISNQWNGQILFNDLSIESPDYPSFTFNSMINNTHFSNISITGQGMNFANFFYNI